MTGNATRPPPGTAAGLPPVQSARQIATAAADRRPRLGAAAARGGAAAYHRLYLDMSLLELSCALGQLAQYRPVMRPGVIYRNASEPGIYIDAAAQAISCTSQDLRGPGHDEPGTGDDQPGTAAVTAARTSSPTPLHGVHRDPPAIRQPAGQRRRRQRLHARHWDHRYRHRQPRSLHAEPADGRADPAAHPAGTRLPVPARSPRLLRGQPGRPARPRRRGPGSPAPPDPAASLPGPARMLPATRPPRLAGASHRHHISPEGEQ